MSPVLQNMFSLGKLEAANLIYEVHKSFTNFILQNTKIKLFTL